ncbi:xylulose kinase [Biomphalaria glabrata]|uniref:Xylulose kinase n=2 Tax=Biomphalaria glabrata TaxID=6526 RepID=A0A9U8EBJ3_BIOGL|nr:xylulose kinase-like isoform X1 [Biomphalaria glabrata]KAI8743448.1 xylulose kinase-like [Biomphalaria glabrata]KAI8778254.1 xylulose kinase [Biomphalaria glabrata]
MAATCESDNLYLGFDFSTQQIKVLAINENLDVVYEKHVQFDTDLSEYNTHGGVHIHEDNITITTPTRMWVKAFDVLLDRMKADNFKFQNVRALSGAGQQHGSVYWKKGSRDILKNCQPDRSLYDQLQDCFSVKDSPVWMDSSTKSQCAELEEKIGGALTLAQVTGSKAYERFTGVQIMKIFQTNRESYDNTERISLVSSFAASLFLGDYAPIDHSDGTGMNLLDIWTRSWSEKCLEICGSDLASKLGEPVHSSQNIGTVSNFLVSRYGFNPECIVAAFVGDNPASLAGLAPEQDDVIVSLGTSDTVFLWLSHPTPGLSGHIFANPLNKKDFMSLTCFKNGSLTRERIRDQYAGGSWEIFSEILQKTSQGNNGNLGIYFDIMEIQPTAQGIFRFDSEGKEVAMFPPEIEVRAVIEGQFVARRVYAEKVGCHLGPSTRIIATGGGSKNKEILQVLADVFNSPVYVKDVPNSACLGCALRAKHTSLGPDVSFSEVAKETQPPLLIASPDCSSDIYLSLCERYTDFERKLQANQILGSKS